MNRTNKRALVAWFVVPAALIGLWAVWPTPHPNTPADSPVASQQPSRSETATDHVEPEQRQSMPPPGDGQPTPATATAVEDAPESDFDRLVEELVEGAIKAKQLHGEDDPDARKEHEAYGREILARLQREIEEPGFRALNKLLGLDSEDTTVRGSLRRQICVSLIRVYLERKLGLFKRGGSRKALDYFVTSLLDSLAMDEKIAGELAALLIGKPYLGVAHEHAVLDLVAQSRKDRFLARHVVELLDTLWKNLAAEGARSSDELLNLALMFRRDTNPAKRIVAMRTLLLAGQARYREFAVQEVMASKDRELIREMAHTAATKLPPDVAVETLQSLTLDVDDPATMGAFLALGARDSAVVSECYETNLANGTRPDVRAELITAIGFEGGPRGVKLARLAFDQDPDLDVRMRAVYAIAGNGSPRQAERVLLDAIADERLRRDPFHAGALVHAVKNLAESKSFDALARVGKQLRTLTALRPGDRKLLEQILRRALPGGSGGGR